MPTKNATLIYDHTKDQRDFSTKLWKPDLFDVIIAKERQKILHIAKARVKINGRGYQYEPSPAWQYAILQLNFKKKTK